MSEFKTEIEILRFDLREITRHYAEAKAQVERLTRERDEARAELAATERCITPKALETATRVAFEQRDKAERERDELRALLQAARDFKNGPTWEEHRWRVEGLEAERDEAFRRGAEAQREASAEEYIRLLTEENIEYDGWVAAGLRCAPLVTDAEVKP